MYLRSSLALTALCLGASALVTQSQRPLGTKDCANVVIIGCRGTMEEPPFGALQYVIGNISEKIAGAATQFVDYPAAGIKKNQNPPPKLIYNYVEYVISELEGHANLLYQLHDYASRCPNSLFALLGYSQGAHIVGDVLCGKTTPFRNPLEPQIAAKVAAIMQYGDPSNWADLPWHKGTSKLRGLLPRKSFDNCWDYGDRWVSYCDAHDPFCAPGLFGNDDDVHLHYAKVYGQAAIDFVVEKVEAALEKQAAERGEL